MTQSEKSTKSWTEKTTGSPSQSDEPNPAKRLSDKDIFATDPLEWTPEKIEEAKARLRKVVERFRRARGEAAEVDAAKAEERAAKKAKRNKNVDIDQPLKGSKRVKKAAPPADK